MSKFDPSMSMVAMYKYFESTEFHILLNLANGVQHARRILDQMPEFVELRKRMAWHTEYTDDGPYRPAEVGVLECCEWLLTEQSPDYYDAALAAYLAAACDSNLLNQLAEYHDRFGWWARRLAEPEVAGHELPEPLPEASPIRTPDVEAASPVPIPGTKPEPHVA